MPALFSVMSNVVPGPIQQFTNALHEENNDKADQLAEALKPLFGMVTIISEQETPFGANQVKARNPLPIKTLMSILGMPSGPCRRPLGKMNKSGLNAVLEIAKTVQSNNPEVFAPIAEYFGVNIADRLEDRALLSDLAYQD